MKSAKGVHPSGTVPAHDDGLPETTARIGIAEQLDVVGVEEVGDREQDVHAGLVQDVAPFTALEAGVDRHDHPAGGMHPERSDGPLPDVRRPDGDPVTGLNARGHHRPGGPMHLVPELDPRPVDVPVDQRLSITEALSGVIHQLRNRLPRRRTHPAHSSDPPREGSVNGFARVQNRSQILLPGWVSSGGRP